MAFGTQPKLLLPRNAVSIKAKIEKRNLGYM